MAEPPYRLEFCLPSDKRVHRAVSEVQRSLQNAVGVMLTVGLFLFQML